MVDAPNRPHNQKVAAGLPESDRELFDALDREQLYDYINMLVKNIWRVDGLYFLGIEKRHDMQEATDVDAECWRYMGKVEARELKKFLGVEEPDPAGVLRLLRHTSWSVSHALKSFSVNDDGSAVFNVDSCRTQKIRVDKGLGEHPCRQVREGYLMEFVSQCNSALKLECVSCPPDRTTDEVYCRWVIKEA